MGTTTGNLTEAADRLTAFCAAIIDAQERAHVPAGQIDRLDNAQFHEQATAIYASSLSLSYVHAIGEQYLAAAQTMDDLRSEDDWLDDRRWDLVRGAMHRAAQSLMARGCPAGPDDNVIVLECNAIPAGVRFDLIAALVTRRAVLELLEASVWASDRARAAGLAAVNH